MSTAVYSQQFDIQSHHITQFFEVSVPYLLGCFQQTAEKHVDSLGIGWNDLHKKGCFWAIYRMGLQIHRLPRKNETITIRTWANPPQRIMQPRSFEVIDSQGCIIVQAQSVWIILDNQTFKPQTIEQVADCQKSTYKANDDDFHLNLKIGNTDWKSSQTVITRDVLFSDIDTNCHVNNANYVKWYIDSLPIDFLHKHSLKQIVINYTQQARFGDSYTIFSHQESCNAEIVSIVRQDEELCKIKAVWE